MRVHTREGTTFSLFIIQYWYNTFSTKANPKRIKNTFMLEKNLAVAKNVGNVLVTTKMLKYT